MKTKLSAGWLKRTGQRLKTDWNEIIKPYPMEWTAMLIIIALFALWAEKLLAEHDLLPDTAVMKDGFYDTLEMSRMMDFRKGDLFAFRIPDDSILDCASLDGGPWGIDLRSLADTSLVYTPFQTRPKLVGRDVYLLSEDGRILIHYGADSLAEEALYSESFHRYMMRKAYLLEKQVEEEGLDFDDQFEIEIQMLSTQDVLNKLSRRKIFLDFMLKQTRNTQAPG